MPSTLYYTMFELPIGSLYFSTLLANLNSRRYVLGDGGIWATRTIAHTQTETTSGSGSGGAGAGVEGAVRMIPVDTGRRGSRGLGFGGRAAVTVQGRRAEELEGEERRRGVLTHHVRPVFLLSSLSMLARTCAPELLKGFNRVLMLMWVICVWLGCGHRDQGRHGRPAGCGRCRIRTRTRTGRSSTDDFEGEPPLPYILQLPFLQCPLSTCIMSDPISLHRDKTTMCKIGPVEPKLRLCRQVLEYKLYRYAALYDRPSRSQDRSGPCITYMVPSRAPGSPSPHPLNLACRRPSFRFKFSVDAKRTDTKPSRLTQDFKHI